MSENLEQSTCVVCEALLDSIPVPGSPPMCDDCAANLDDEPDPDTGRGSYKDRIENPEDY